MIHLFSQNNPKALLNWYRQAGYPILSADLEEILDKVKCPEDIKELLDRVLWANLSGGELIKEFTIYEALKLDNWVSNNLKPKDFPFKLERQLEKELGICFVS